MFLYTLYGGTWQPNPIISPAISVVCIFCKLRFDDDFFCIQHKSVYLLVFSVNGKGRHHDASSLNLIMPISFIHIVNYLSTRVMRLILAKTRICNWTKVNHRTV